MMPMMLPLGAMTTSETATLSAVVLDLETGKPACRLRSDASGVGVMLTWVVFTAVFVPPTGWAAKRRLGSALVDFFAEEVARGPLRIAVMAAEASGDPFVPYEGAPITVGRDIAVGEMVNRLAEIEAEVIPGTTHREEIRRHLGKPMASDSQRRAEIYRFTAVAASETRPLIYLGYFDFLAREAWPYAGYLLVAYDTDGKVVGLDSAFVADEIPLPESTGDLFSDRSAYDYSFRRSDSASVEGFRLEVEFYEDGTRESLYSEPDGALVFQNGEWSRSYAP